MQDVGKIKVQMLLQGISQTAIAKSAGVHKSFICNVLRGRDKPSAKVKKAFEKHGIIFESEEKCSG